MPCTTHGTRIACKRRAYVGSDVLLARPLSVIKSNFTLRHFQEVLKAVVFKNTVECRCCCERKRTGPCLSARIKLSSFIWLINYELRSTANYNQLQFTSPTSWSAPSFSGHPSQIVRALNFFVAVVLLPPSEEDLSLAEKLRSNLPNSPAVLLPRVSRP